MRTAEKACRYYNEWNEYDETAQEDGYRLPKLLVKALRRYISGGERILDVGCGTGLVGIELAKTGWRGTLVGVDISTRRLADAKAKRVYAQCRCMNAYHLRWQRQRFDVVVSNGLIGIAGPRALGEMWRVLKPGGCLVCTIGKFTRPGAAWSRDRFQKSCKLIRVLPGARQLVRRNIGSCYTKHPHKDHYTLYAVRRV